MLYGIFGSQFTIDYLSRLILRPTAVNQCIVQPIIPRYLHSNNRCNQSNICQDEFT